MNSHSTARGRLRGWALPTSPWLRLLLGLVGLVALLALTLVGFRLARPGVLPGVEIAGQAVGGHDRGTLTETVDSLVAERLERPITVVLDVDEQQAVTSARSELGYTADGASTVAAAWERGRQLNPIAALLDHLRAFGSGIDVPLSESLDHARLGAWADRVAGELSSEEVEGEIAIDGDEVSVVLPEAGAVVDRDALADEAAVAALAPGEQRIVASSAAIEPRTDPEQVSAVAERARRAVAGPVRLTRDEAGLELDGAQIGALLAVERIETDDAVYLELVSRPDRLRVDEATVAALETDPVDASIQLVSGEVEVTPSTDGFRFDAEIAAAQVLAVATASSNPRQAELRGRVVEPGLSTADAHALQITERVSSFTTFHACCQGRVQNIQRMADIVRGVVLRPGEEFSINAHVGRRTEAGGFTEGGVIIRGEFEEAIGGGVSQFATTFFGAAYEGGYEILQHQPHSYYISRYPAGREATLNYPELDVRIRNDSPYGLLIHTRYTPTSITVDFYGKQWVEVEEWTNPRTNVRPPPEEMEENPDLPPGTEEVVQSGRDGFDVSYTRRRRFPDGSVDEQTWSHRYRPEPRIIEHNPEEQPEDDDEDDNEDGDED